MIGQIGPARVGALQVGIAADAVGGGIVLIVAVTVNVDVAGCLGVGEMSD